MHVPAALEPGGTLGAYHLDSVIGEGGMGVVFRAQHENGSQVALKVLKRELAGDYVFQQRFRQEARAAAEVRNPYLVPIVEAGEVEGHHYLAVDFVPGGSLAERLEANGVLTPAATARVVSNVAQGLDALHEAGIFHRDVKPGNVLFDEEGNAKLTDFGLAKGRAYTVLTRPGQVIGTLDYLAPELIRGEPATALSDVYALGCVAYECAVGKTPFADKSFFQIGIAHLEEEPPDPRALRPELTDRFAEALLLAQAKKPPARPQSAGAYAASLRAAVETQ